MAGREAGAPADPRIGSRRLAIAATVSMGVPIALIAVVVHRLSQGSDATSRAARVSHANTTAQLFIAAAVICGAALFGGHLAGLARQPRVIGEIAVGIALGPTLLGRFAPGVMAALFPPDVQAVLRGLATVGLVPFAGGTAVASGLDTSYVGSSGSRLAFVLFLGCALSITAFPVLAGRTGWDTRGQSSQRDI